MATTKSTTTSALKKGSRIVSTCTGMKSKYAIPTISKLSTVSNNKDECCSTTAKPPTTTIVTPKRKRAESEIISTDEIISPERALRIAMLKRRFADTIVKATHQLHGDAAAVKSCDAKQQQQREKEILIAEQIRIEEEIKSKSEGLKKRRERERLARENMKKTVEFNDQNKYIMRELAAMDCGLKWDGINPLKRLGLFLKRDDYDYDLEQGEII